MFFTLSTLVLLVYYHYTKYTQTHTHTHTNTHTYIYIYISIMKIMCAPGYHQNGFVATYALGHMMYCYTLLVPMNQRLLKKLSKEHSISGHK